MARRCRLSFILRFWNQTCGERGGKSRHPSRHPAPRDSRHRPLPPPRGGSRPAGDRRPAPGPPPRGSCHHVRRDQLNPYKSTERFSGALLLGCLFFFLLARACSDTPPHTPDPGKPGSSASFLPFRSQHYLGLLLSLLFHVQIFLKRQSKARSKQDLLLASSSLLQELSEI